MIALIVAPLVVWFAVKHFTAETGLTHIDDHEVGVLVDLPSAKKTIITSPGWVQHLPWTQQVYPLDKSPIALTFSGNTPDGTRRVPRLLVRANDGSSFWFQELVLTYALVPERASFVLEDSGPGDAFQTELVRDHARAILRDEFGRYTAEDVVKAENLRAATRRSLERLNAALVPHGIEVLEVSTPKPAFDKAYEDQVARAKVFGQDVEALRAKRTQLDEDKSQRESAVRKEKEIEEKRLEGDLLRDTAAAERELVRATSEIENEALAKISEGRMVKAEKEAQAAVVEARYRALAEDARQRASVYERWGETAVRAALIDNLGAIRFDIVPYSRDSEPRRIEHEQVSPTAVAGGK